MPQGTSRRSLRPMLLTNRLLARPLIADAVPRSRTRRRHEESTIDRRSLRGVHACDAPALTDPAGGHIDFMMTALVAGKAHIDAGRLTPLDAMVLHNGDDQGAGAFRERINARVADGHSRVSGVVTMREFPCSAAARRSSASVRPTRARAAPGTAAALVSDVHRGVRECGSRRAAARPRSAARRRAPTQWPL